MNQQMIDKIRAEEDATEAERKEAALQEKYDFANIPKALRKSTPKAIPEAAEHKVKVFEWQDRIASAYIQKKTESGLYMYGNYGSGKTSIAAGLGMWAIRNKLKTYFVPYTDLYEISKNNSPRFENIEGSLWDYIQTVPLLIVDDLFRHSNERYGMISASVFESLLEGRMRNNLLHIFTANAPLDALNSTYMERSARLIIESCYLLEVSGVDFRDFLNKRRKTL